VSIRPRGSLLFGLGPVQNVTKEEKLRCFIVRTDWAGPGLLSVVCPWNVNIGSESMRPKI